MRFVIPLLVTCILVLQVRLWYGEGSFIEVKALEKEVAQQTLNVEKLKDRNQTLEAEVQDLKQRLGAIEERARTDLGMIRQGERFYQYSIKDE